jgi:hypothetical protein
MDDIKRRPYKMIPLAEKEKIEKFTGMSLHTLRNWRTQKKHLDLFIPIGGKVFLDCREWVRFVRKAKRESVREAKRMQELTG